MSFTPVRLVNGSIRSLRGGAVFANQRVIRQEREQQKLQAQLYEEIGRLKVELEWLKKTARYS